MKTLKYYLFIFLLGIMFTKVKAQDAYEGSLGLPGDNLNLYAVMKLFQESKTLEDFERSLNTEDSHINNLDLDGDGNIDYIKVEDNVDGSVHTIVLKDAITPHENQDIAVFTVERFANNEVQIQLIGDEELYGKDYIVEPYYDDADGGVTPNPGYAGNADYPQGKTIVVQRTTYVEVASWPLIHFIFLPSYRVWHSPWYYGYYPHYWRTWHPFYWHKYYGYHYHYHNYYYGHYRHTNHYRYAHWNDNYYKNRRAHSELVYQRRQAGDYKNTYSRPDTRKAGSELYTKSHRRDNMSPGKRPATREGVYKPSNRQGTKRSSARTDTKNQSAGPRDNTQSKQRDIKKSSSRSGVDKQAPRQKNDKQDSRTDKNKKNKGRNKTETRSEKDKKGR